MGSKLDTGGGAETVDMDQDGYANDVDCDDSDPQIHPGASELCDGVDNDCDGFVDADDPSLEGAGSYHPDLDGDGFGDGTDAVTACEAPSGHLVDGSDCDDGDAAINPDAVERCDGVDNDCDGVVDEDDAEDALDWHLDADEDGWGTSSHTVQACEQPSGYVGSEQGGDCDDGDPAVNPDAIEVCDGVDNDCDGEVDQGAVDASSWYLDYDMDGYGAAEAGHTIQACDDPGDPWAATADDCDDLEPTTHPGADEWCDGLDNDCDGQVDESGAVDAVSWHADTDGDGYGDASSSLTVCEQPPGTVEDATDCDDTDGEVNPGAQEVCDGVDNDCDGLVDDADSSVTGGSTWYADADGDGFGDAASTTTACDQPTGYLADASDCDDADSSVTVASTWYEDTDGDGYGDAAVTAASCMEPSGYASDATDCDDTDGTVNPGASEICDGLDNDCDGFVDDADSTVTGGSTWYADTDGDGYGDAASTTTACDQPTGYLADANDCDDADSAVTVASTWYEDGDGDGFGDAASTTTACDQPTGYVADASDCDDADSSVTVASTWYEDADEDGYGDVASTTTGCTEPSGHVSDATDCDDEEVDVNPGASEDCNGLDDDCDGTIDSDAACGCTVGNNGDHAYLFCEEIVTWYEAQAACRALDSYDLVTIDDATEQSWVYGMIVAVDASYWWWIGYNDLGATSSEEPDQAWEWADGSSSTYTNWNTVEPYVQPDDWGGNEDCAHVYGSDGTWNDMDCTLDEWYGDYLYYVCESSTD